MTLEQISTALGDLGFESKEDDLVRIFNKVKVTINFKSNNTLVIKTEVGNNIKVTEYSNQITKDWDSRDLKLAVHHCIAKHINN